MSACMYAWMYVCMDVCMHGCMRMHLYTCNNHLFGYVHVPDTIQNNIVQNSSFQCNKTKT